MNNPETVPQRVVIIGAGRMGLGIGSALASRGWQVTSVSRARKPAPPGIALSTGPAAPVRATRLVLIATPDDVVAGIAAGLQSSGVVSPQHVVLHMSGLLDRSALAPLGATGAALGSFHPLQTIVDTASAANRLRGAYAGIEGEGRAIEAGLTLASALDMVPVVLAPGSKPLYHAGAVFAANYTTVLAGLAERLAMSAGIPKETAARMYVPLFIGAAQNLAELGPVEALTGPIRRGDVDTVKAHLGALPRDVEFLYRALGLAALELAAEAGLPDPVARNIGSLLEEGSMEQARKNISSGSPWEPTVGYSRAVRVGPYVHVAGTTGTDGQGRAISADVYVQARHALGKISDALTEAGARLDQVVRTRIFVTDIRRWEDVGRAHGEVFAHVRPAATMVEVRRLIGPDILVEIEADAYVG
jgi:predicted short-subunit dehydrogenase-like oxidoreductase (DUF2520 family)/enamine deaminase RidA (YjgF/YER057c/UK114 family)